jgi:hypothetical protein
MRDVSPVYTREALKPSASTIWASRQAAAQAELRLNCRLQAGCFKASSAILMPGRSYWSGTKDYIGAATIVDDYVIGAVEA